MEIRFQHLNVILKQSPKLVTGNKISPHVFTFILDMFLSGRLNQVMCWKVKVGTIRHRRINFDKNLYVKLSKLHDIFRFYWHKVHGKSIQYSKCVFKKFWLLGEPCCKNTAEGGILFGTRLTMQMS